MPEPRSKQESCNGCDIIHLNISLNEKRLIAVLPNNNH